MKIKDALSTMSRTRRIRTQLNSRSFHNSVSMMETMSSINMSPIVETFENSDIRVLRNASTSGVSLIQ